MLWWALWSPLYIHLTTWVYYCIVSWGFVCNRKLISSENCGLHFQFPKLHIFISLFSIPKASIKMSLSSEDCNLHPGIIWSDNKQFYGIMTELDHGLHLKRLRTYVLLNTSKQLVQVHWSLVRSRWRRRRIAPIIFRKEEVKVKGVQCGNIVSSMYPQWVITWYVF